MAMTWSIHTWDNAERADWGNRTKVQIVIQTMPGSTGRSPEKDGYENGPAEERVNRLRVKPRDTRPVLSVMIRVLGEMFFEQVL
jgi:hypothetical protein